MIVKGKICFIDDLVVCVLFGVLEVLIYQNVMNLFVKIDIELYFFQNCDVYYYGEYIGVVIVEMQEIVWYVVSLVKVEYDVEEEDICFCVEYFDCYSFIKINIGVFVDSKQGDVDKGLVEVVLVVDEVYIMFYEYYNLMEMYLVIVEWDKEKFDGVLGVFGEWFYLWIYDVLQGVLYEWLMLLLLLGLLLQQVEINLFYVGGVFGFKGIFYVQVMLIILVVKLLLGCLVKYMLICQQMFCLVGYCLIIYQYFWFGVVEDGMLIIIIYDVQQSISCFKQFVEQIVNVIWYFYVVFNCEMSICMVLFDIGLVIFMWVFGEFFGMFVQEIVMDELVVKLGLDFIELWLCNQFEIDLESGKFYFSYYLKECLQEGVWLFGWEKCYVQFCVWQEGEWFYGMGVVSVIYFKQMILFIKVSVVFKGGKYYVSIVVVDLGIGVWMVLIQIVVDVL